MRAWRMRPRVLLLAAALAGCDDEATGGAADASPTTDAAAEAPDAGAVALIGVEPDHLPARGGELTISGAGFAEPLTARLAGVALEVLAVADDTLRVRAPALPVGPADLSVMVEGHPPAILPRAVQVEPSPLTFAPGLPDLAEAPEAGEVRDAVAFDVDRDGDPDLVLATDDGLRVLLNDGAGRFTLARGPAAEDEPPPPLRPGGRGDVRALAVRPGDADRPPELVVCTGAARDLVLRGSAAGLEAVAQLPLRRGICRAAAVGTPGGIGLAFLIEADGEVALHVVPAGAAAPTFADAFAPPDEEEAPVGAATASDPEATVSFTRAPGIAAEGAAAGDAAFTTVAPDAELVFSLPAALPEVPHRLRLHVQLSGGATVHPRIIDATGAAFDGRFLDAGAAWRAVEAADVAAWPRADGGEEPPEPPIQAVALVVRVAEPGEGRLRVDTVVAERDGEMPALIEDFERRTPRFAWPTAHGLLIGDLDGDVRDDLLVLRGDAAPALLRTASGDPTAEVPLRAHAVGLREPGGVAAGVLLDADHDGDLDALLVGPGRDRLLVGDGHGRLLDASAGALPIDRAEGRAVAAADLDGDGRADVVIGNAGSTDRLYLARGDGRYLDATPDFGFDELDTAAVVLLDVDADGDTDAVSVPRSGDARPLLRFAVEGPK